MTGWADCREAKKAGSALLLRAKMIEVFKFVFFCTLVDFVAQPLRLEPFLLYDT